MDENIESGSDVKVENTENNSSSSANSDTESTTDTVIKKKIEADRIYCHKFFRKPYFPLSLF